jgi:BirA family biotin operon repressor/biotin-[acetyl-CoA-carboxylase] ligase
MPSGSVVASDFQTAGRGQPGTAWESEAGRNLTFSLLYLPAGLPANRPFAISEMISLSVKRTLDRYIPGVSVKWPNDIYCGDSKIAGILIENIIMQGQITKSVIGIGLNVNQTVFCGGAPNPVSMRMITGRLYDTGEILGRFMQEFARQSARLDGLCYEAIHSDYLDLIYRKEGFHKYADANGEFLAEINAIEPAGHLVLRRTDGSLSRYGFKEVHIRR